MHACTRGLSPPYGLTAEIRVYDIESRLFLAAHLPHRRRSTIVESNIFDASRDLRRITTTYFLSLRLLDATGAQVADNFYWLSTKPDVLDYQAKVKPWEYYTPSKELRRSDDAQLPAAGPGGCRPIALRHRAKRITVELTNRSDRIAFFIELLLTDEHTGEPIVPDLLAGQLREPPAE